MKQMIPFEKLSKKEKQKRNAARRGSWYGLNPVTRKPQNVKAYNRRKARKWSEDSMTVPFVISAHFLRILFKRSTSSSKFTVSKCPL